MPTICILGGTPSTKEIVRHVPDSLQGKFNIISFDRPGFGENEDLGLNTSVLSQLAGNAGLHKEGYGIIGISGGAPLAIYLADMYNIKHCGVINGMVSRQAYFRYSTSAITKDLMSSLQEGYEAFEANAMKFPNIDKIVESSGSSTKKKAIRACYDELRFILSDSLHESINNKSLHLDWWHGEKDSNVPLASVELFLKDYKRSNLTIIPGADHNVDLNKYIAEIIAWWESGGME